MSSECKRQPHGALPPWQLCCAALQCPVPVLCCLAGRCAYAAHALTPGARRLRAAGLPCRSWGNVVQHLLGLLGFFYTHHRQPGQAVTLRVVRDQFDTVTLGFLSFIKQKKLTGDYMSKISHSGGWEGSGWVPPAGPLRVAALAGGHRIATLTAPPALLAAGCRCCKCSAQAGVLPESHLN